MAKLNYHLLLLLRPHFPVNLSDALCLFRVACLGKMLFGRSKITFLQIGAGGIEIRCLIIWEEADGNVEYLVKLWRTRLVSLCHQEHLLQRKLLWFGLQYLFGLFDAERTNRVGYRIVAMTGDEDRYDPGYSGN